MKFTAAVIVAALSMVATATPIANAQEGTVASIEKRNVQWWIKATDNNLDKSNMKACLNNMDTGNWHSDYTCGGMHWQTGESAYNSPGDCYAACYNDLIAGIDRGASDQECRDWEGVGHCWMQMWKI